ncbi:unnamed protein product [Orchesella dallaii]|uniref:Glucosylceramidase n=1 Tax=Orchesella dallaii TaxID=48710 RepID=A0ABP1QP91_9HEXA
MASFGFLAFLVVFIAPLVLGSLPCSPIDFGRGSIVCECNATYCDTVDPINQVELGKYMQVFSDKSGARFAISEGSFSDVAPPENSTAVKVTIDRNVKYQEILGFGGAFTDAAGISIASLSQPLQEAILKQYFDGEIGLNYSIARVPMAGTDFSTRTYSYNDVENDTSLSSFSLEPEDLQVKIPYVQMAKLLQPNLRLYASPWSAPKWMKTNNEFYGMGSLKPEYYQVWANYFVKFLESYAEHNITFWAVTAQNEPTDGNIPGFSFNCMGWTSSEQRDWIKNNLGPTLANSSHSDVKIIMLDDQRIQILNWTRTVLSDPDAEKYVSGIGLHWYVDALVSPAALDVAHSEFPNKFMLGTEACAGALPLEESVVLGSWERAEMYASDIITDLNHWVTGWVDWNIALNMTGGPNWAHNEVDSPLIVDEYMDVFYKQPMFYALGHFSKFIPAGSIRIHHETGSFAGLEILTCLRPDGQIAVVILNLMTENAVELQLTDSERGNMELLIAPDSIYTLVYA